MSAKARITKLESVGRNVATDNRIFVHEVRHGGDVFFIGALKVDSATYTKELAEYLQLRKNDRIPAEIVVMCNYAEVSE
jgi:hypothetical protein